MDRRRFVQLAGLAGLGFVAPIGIKASRADSAKYTGPFWLMVNASGGWDPSFFCDPKGGVVDDVYTTSQIGKAGNLHYAPINGLTNSMETFYTTDKFFTSWYKRLLVINGVDTETNNHDSGSRTTWSGQQEEGFPSFAALTTAQVLSHLDIPLGFLSYGGYDATAGVCSLARVGNADGVERLAYPNTVDPSQSNWSYYNSPTTSARIAAAQAARLQAMRDKQTLPALKTAMSTLFMARGGNTGLTTLAKDLSDATIVTLDTQPDLKNLDQGNLGDLQDLMQQAQIAAYAFKSGVAVAANLNIGGFDTHSNHDDDHSLQITKLLRGLEYIFKEFDALGLSGQTNIIVGSDFARTPYYNAGKGKDHWNITSMMMAGPHAEGNKVIGGTDIGQVSTPVNDSLKADSGGFRITTQHVHVAMRKLAGITGSDNDSLFPIAADLLPIFD